MSNDKVFILFSLVFSYKPVMSKAIITICNVASVRTSGVETKSSSYSNFPFIICHVESELPG